jgi:hypothetical protein
MATSIKAQCSTRPRGIQGNKMCNEAPLRINLTSLKLKVGT